MGRDSPKPEVALDDADGRRRVVQLKELDLLGAVESRHVVAVLVVPGSTHRQQTGLTQKVSDESEARRKNP